MRTTPVPQLLLDCRTVADDMCKSLERGGSQILPGTLDFLQRLHELLPMDVMPMAIHQSQKKMETLSSGDFDSNDAERISGIFLDARMAFSRAYDLLTVPQQEKLSVTEQESATIGNTPVEIREVSRFDYDACNRIEEQTNEHRWKRKMWTRNLMQTYTGGLVTMRDKQVTSFLVREWQYLLGDKHLLLNLGIHPDTEEDGPYLLDQHLQKHSRFHITMAVRERREWLWKLLRNHGFKSERNSRNHYRFQNDFEDAMIMSR